MLCILLLYDFFGGSYFSLSSVPGLVQSCIGQIALGVLEELPSVQQKAVDSGRLLALLAVLSHNGQQQGQIDLGRP